MAFTIPSPEKPVHRFPRTKDKIPLYIAQLRAKYPGPMHNWKYGPSINPSDMILDWLGQCSRKKLKRLADKHALNTHGGRRKIIKRMYLHWRAAKFQTGDPYIGYGKGFESTREPNCVCGFRKRADIVREEKQKEEHREMVKRQRHDAIKLGNRLFEIQQERKLHPRFPRLRFPRLKPKDVKRIEKWGGYSVWMRKMEERDRA